jgi:hypothetical protein
MRQNDLTGSDKMTAQSAQFLRDEVRQIAVHREVARLAAMKMPRLPRATGASYSV